MYAVAKIYTQKKKFRYVVDNIYKQNISGTPSQKTQQSLPLPSVLCMW